MEASFQGLIAPSSPLLVRGVLTPETVASLAFEADEVPTGPLLETPRAILLLRRDKVPAGPDSDLFAPKKVSNQPFFEEFEVERARLWLHAAEPVVRLQAHAMARPFEATLEGPSCMLRPGPLEESHLETAQRLLWLRCPTADVDLRATEHVDLMGNATLILEYDEAGTKRSREIVLRTASSDPRTWATAWDAASVLVAPDDRNETLWRAPGASHVEVRTPHVAIEGTLRLPGGTGRLAWGDRNMGPNLPEVELEGTFLASARSDRYIDLRGAAQAPESPPAAKVAPRDPLPKAGLLAATGGGLLALLAYASRGAWILLFTRLTSDRALDHERRAAIADAVAAHPGARIQDVARLIRLHKAVASYHVRVLERQGVIVLARWGRHTALFLRDRHPPSVQRTFIHLRRRGVPELLRRLREHPTARQDDLASVLGVSRSRVAVLVKELEEAGMLRRGRDPHGQTRYDVLVEDLPEPRAPCPSARVPTSL